MSKLPIYEWMRKCPQCARLLKRVTLDDPVHCLGCGWMWDGEEEKEPVKQRRRR